MPILSPWASFRLATPPVRPGSVLRRQRCCRHLLQFGLAFHAEAFRWTQAGGMDWIGYLSGRSGEFGLWRFRRWLRGHRPRFRWRPQPGLSMDPPAAHGRSWNARPARRFPRRQGPGDFSGRAGHRRDLACRAPSRRLSLDPGRRNGGYLHAGQQQRQLRWPGEQQSHRHFLRRQRGGVRHQRRRPHL